MKELENAVGPEPPEAKPSGGSRSWAWLDALGRSLEFAAGLIDQHGGVGPIVGAPAVTSTLGKLLTDSKSPVSDAARRALRLNQAQQETAGSLVAVCNPVNLQNAPVGVLALAHESMTSSDSGRHRVVDVQMIVPWLTRAVEAHLGRALAEDSADSFDRVASLHRLLQEAVERGSEKEVATTFAEALFAWDGVETSGYVEDFHGRLVLAMSAPGAARGHDVVDLTALSPPRGGALVRLTSDDLERFGFPTFRHVIAIEIGDTTQNPWVLLFSEGYRALNVSRIGVYADLLRDALARAAMIVETRTTWAILQPLLGADDAEAALDASLRDFSRIVGVAHASIVVLAANGATQLSVGEPALLQASRSRDSRNLLVSTAPLPDGSTLHMMVRRDQSHTFTRREQRLVDRTAAIYSAWLPGSVRRPAERGERRAENRAFDDVLERAAAQILRDGVDVSLLVIAVKDVSARPYLLQSWVTQLRAQLRGADLTGTISDHEIGVLLFGTSPTEVPVVCGRLRQRLGLTDKDQTTTFGSASRIAGSADTTSLVRAARRNVITGFGSPGNSRMS